MAAISPLSSPYFPPSTSPSLSAEALAFERETDRAWQELAERERREEAPSCAQECIKTCLEKAIDISIYPLEHLNRAEPGLYPRVLFVAQLIMSIIATPFFLLATLFGPLIACAINEPLCNAVKGLALLTYMHLQLIPTSVIGIFSPELADKYAETCLPNL